MSINVICIYTVEDYDTIDQLLPSGTSIHFGLAIIATMLKVSGHNVRLLVFTPSTPLDDTLRPLIEDLKPQLVCFTAVSTQFLMVERISAHVKKLDPSIFIVVGGAHASLAPDETLASANIDGICISEGEIGILELARQIEEGHQPQEIPNFWLKINGKSSVKKNLTIPFQDNLDRLPFIDRELWRGWIKQPIHQAAILIGRGCPNHCTYCSNHALRRLAPGRYVRFRSPANIIDELVEIGKDPLINHIYFEIETITANMEFCHELCQRLSVFNRDRQKPIKFSLNGSFTSNFARNSDTVNNFFLALKEANIVTLKLGLESGSERIRNEVLKRPGYSNEEIISFCKQANKYGIGIITYLLIGLPGETLGEFQKTIEVTRQCTPEMTDLSIFYPYPGTSLYIKAQQEKLFDPCTLEHKNERHFVALNLPGFSRSRILKEFVLINYRVFKKRWSFARRLNNVFYRTTLLYPYITPFYASLRNSMKFLVKINRYSLEFVLKLRDFITTDRQP
jgi:radical SAM superfamily enzyme YgiQ (UPF0313 family)